MANWQSYNLAALFPQEIADAVDGLADVSGQIADASDLAATAVEALSALVVDVSDPLNGIIDTLIQTLEGTVLDTLNTGIYFYYDIEGWPIGPPGGLQGWKGRFTRSFDDSADDQRPKFSQTAQLGAIIIVGGAPSFGELANLLLALGKLFGIKTFRDAYLHFHNTIGQDPLEDIARGVANAPDWHSARVRDYFPPLNDLALVIDQVIDGIRVAGGATELLQNLANALRAKADKLRDVSGRIQGIVDLIGALLATSGLYVLPVESETGVPGLKDAFSQAENPPPLQADSYVVGVCLLAGYTDYQALRTLFGV